MDFATAVRTCLTKYADFSGRARRSEYWWFVAFNLLVSVAAAVVDTAMGTDLSAGTGVVGGLTSLALLLPNLAAGARRLHDTSRSGWWLLVGLVPLVGWIVLIVLFVQGSHEDNEYGPDPTAAATR